jgi:ribonuclease HI
VISIYSDGSSGAGGGKPGGYGWIIVKDEQVLAWSYGGSPATTNNLMEMEGAIQGLEAVLELKLHETGEPLELVSDSQYTLGIASGAYTATKNLESASRLQDLTARVGCRLRWVRGHNGETFNEKCDALAKQGKIENTPPEVLARKAKKRAKKASEPTL